MEYVYGIDFGTTNSVLAIYDMAKAEVIKTFTMPSLLFFPEFQESRHYFEYGVGKNAIEMYLNSGMKGRFMKSIKAVLSNSSFSKTRIASQFYTVEDLVALIIKELKVKADNYLGLKVNEAVIGRPIFFSEIPQKDVIAQKRLSKAIKLVGFENFYFQYEPIAAAFTYEKEINKNELVLVADFGGGTSDFSLMNLNPYNAELSDRKSDLLAKGGVYVGGDSFDSKLMWHKITPHFGRGIKEKFADKWLELPNSYYTKITSWDKMNFLNTYKMIESIKRSYVFSGKDFRVKNLLTLIEQNLGYSLFKEVENTKMRLTNIDMTTFTFEEVDICVKESVNIEEYGSVIIDKEIEKIMGYLDEFFIKNNLTANKVDTVFLTGGTSMVRPLRKLFIEKFGIEKIKSGDNFNSVAKGLALSYPMLAK